MSHRALSLILVASLLPAGAAFATESKHKVRHGDRMMYAHRAQAPAAFVGAAWAAPAATDAPDVFGRDPLTSANGQ